MKFKFTVLLKNDFVLVNTESEEVEGDDIVKLIILMVCVLVNTESEEVEGDDIVKLIILMVCVLYIEY